jgi:propane 2-monooxygenase small subunit
LRRSQATRRTARRTAPRPSTWTAASVAAAHQLQPIWSQLPEKVVRFEDSFGRSQQRFEGLPADLGLDTPKELSA